MSLSLVDEVCRNLLCLGVGMLGISTLVLLTGLLATRVLRRRGPETQSFLLRLTLGGTVLGMLLSLVVVGYLPAQWRLTIPTLPQITNYRAMEAVSVPEATTKIQQAPDPHAVARMAPAPAQNVDLQPSLAWGYRVVVVIWAGGSLLLLCVLQHNLIQLHSLRRTCTDVATTAPVMVLLQELCADSEVALPRLMVGPEIRSPFLAVLPKAPTIFLPATLITENEEASDETLRVVLAHEVTHLRRYDCQWNLLLCLTCALCWPQPLLWRFRHRLEQVSEEACDARAARQLASPYDYADCLVTLAQRFPPTRVGRTLGTAIVAPHSSLEERIKQLMDRSSSRPPLSRPSRIVLSVGAAFVVLGSVLLVDTSLPLPLRAEQTLPTKVWPVMSAQQEREGKFPKRLVDLLVNLKVNDVPIRVALDKLFADTSMTYRLDASVSSPESVLNTSVTIDFRSAPFPQALDQMIHGLPGRLTYTVEGNEVVIRTVASTLDARGLPTGRVTLQFTKAPLRQVLDNLFSRSEGSYFLPNTVDRVITVDLQNVAFETALQIILDSTKPGLAYKVNAGHITLFEKHVTARPSDIVSSDIPTVPVSGDFADVPLREVIEKIFKSTTLQYSLTRDAYGTVNIRLRDVPLNEALKAILMQSNPPLRAYRQLGGLIVIEPYIAGRK